MKSRSTQEWLDDETEKISFDFDCGFLAYHLMHSRYEGKKRTDITLNRNRQRHIDLVNWINSAEGFNVQGHARYEEEPSPAGKIFVDFHWL